MMKPVPCPKVALVAPLLAGCAVGPDAQELTGNDLPRALPLPAFEPGRQAP